MINALFVIIALAVVYLITNLSNLIMKIASDLKFASHFSRHPIEKTILHMLVLGALSLMFLFFISFPFTARTGFNTDNLDVSLRMSFVFCMFILIFLLLVMFFYKKAKGDAPTVPYSLLEDEVEGDTYAKVRKSHKTIIYWLVYRWLVPGVVMEVLFRGIVFTIVDWAIKGYLDLGVFHLSYSVIITQIIYHLSHVKVKTKPFRLEASLWEHVGLIPLGLFTSITYYYTDSLIGPIIMHSFYSGMSAVLYVLFTDKDKYTLLHKD
jgi:membrane protease YdiL (CAAX protease family)